MNMQVVLQIKESSLQLRIPPSLHAVISFHLPCLLISQKINFSHKQNQLRTYIPRSKFFVAQWMLDSFDQVRVRPNEIKTRNLIRAY
jgi:hypothetical protein